MNKKLVFVIQIDIDDHYAKVVAMDLDSWRREKKKTYDGHVKIDEVKVQD